MNHDNVVIIWHVDKACHIGGASDGRGTERGSETEGPCGASQRPGGLPISGHEAQDPVFARSGRVCRRVGRGSRLRTFVGGMSWMGCYVTKAAGAKAGR